MWIEDWEWDDRNLAYVSRRGCNPEIVFQVQDRRPRHRLNLKDRAASHQMIGPDNGGRIWTICYLAAPGGPPGMARAVNTWRADKEEQGWYDRQK